MTTLIFFGSDQYSAVVLKQLLENRNTGIPENLTVITDPHTPPNPVESMARELSLPLTYYTDFATCNLQLATSQSETVGLTASFPHLFPTDLITAFNGQLYNLHPSLLPQYRNVAPVPYAIALGDQVTGITLFCIAPTIDNGEIISQVEEPILPEDTTPTLLTRLFTKGANLFINTLLHQKQGYEPCKDMVENKVRNLVFTHRLTRQSGFVEWDVVQKLLQGQALKAQDTQNELLRLRLSRQPCTTHHVPCTILSDLIRALTGYEKVWTIAPTKKGDLPISFSLPPNHVPSTMYYVLVPGKPRPIPYSDFTKYYLSV